MGREEASSRLWWCPLPDEVWRGSIPGPELITLYANALSLLISLWKCGGSFQYKQYASCLFEHAKCNNLFPFQATSPTLLSFWNLLSALVIYSKNFILKMLILLLWIMHQSIHTKNYSFSISIMNNFSDSELSRISQWKSLWQNTWNTIYLVGLNAWKYT